MKISVGVAAVKLPILDDQTALVQNLGTGVVYVDADPAVTAATGVQIPVNGSILFDKDMNKAGGALYLISTIAATDVRYMIVG